MHVTVELDVFVVVLGNCHLAVFSLSVVVS